MKTLLGLLSVLVCFTVQAATWTIHGFKDNALEIFITSDPTYIQCGDTVTGGSGYVSRADWDYGLDQAGFVGTQGFFGALQCGGGYQGVTESITIDSFSISFPSGTIGSSVISGGGTGIYYSDAWISGPYPDYSGFIDFPLPPEGEWWIDFAENGTVRINSTEPADFGKWAWDGSLNPNYVGPLVIHGKSHKKPK